MIAVENRFKDLAPLTEELLTISALENPTKAQHSRINSLMSAISAIKAGSTLAELRRYEQDELRRAAGLSRLPDAPRTALAADIAEEWRNFALGKDVRPTHIPSDNETRANVEGSQSVAFTQAAAGSTLVPQDFSNRCYEVMKTYDQIFDPAYSNVVETATGANMPFPWFSDVDNDSVQVSEAAVSTEVDIAGFGSKQLGAWTFRSKIVAVSTELLQDSQFPIGALLERVFAGRQARGIGRSMVTGSGINTCEGLLTGVIGSGVAPLIASGSSGNDGVVGNTGANSIGTVDIGKLYHSLEPCYRPGACFYMNDNTLRFLDTLLQDKYGRPLVSFRDGLTGSGDVPYIMGKPVAICPSMADIAAASNPIIFGNPLYFISRRVDSSAHVKRYNEAPQLVLNGLVGLESFMRVDSGVIAGNVAHSPFQYIQSHS